MRWLIRRSKTSASVRSLQSCDRGIAVVLISHSMPEVLEIADRIQVLRLGRRVATYSGKETNVEQLVGAMTGALDFQHTENAA